MKDTYSYMETDNCGESPVIPEFFLDSADKGYGLSAGLSRGVQVRYLGHNLTQEGMGIGTVALKQGGLTYFSACFIEAPGSLAYNGTVDVVLLSGIGNLPLRWLSRIWHFGTAIYRKLPGKRESLLDMADGIRRLFGVSNVFQAAEPRGTAYFICSVRDSGLDVCCELKDFTSGGKVCLMNEMGADWFGRGWEKGVPTGAPPPWMELHGKDDYPMLYSEKLDLLFSLHDVALSGNTPFKVYWGREKNDNLCWAGYTIEIELGHTQASALQCTYRIELKRPEQEGGC